VAWSELTDEQLATALNKAMRISAAAMRRRLDIESEQAKRRRMFCKPWLPSVAPAHPHNQGCGMRATGGGSTRRPNS
jgi:hypothetical protein